MKKFSKKALILLISAAALLIFSVGSTVAYLVDATGSVENTFSPTSTGTNIEETTGSTKTDVYVTNTGDISAYIRARYLITWQNAAGDIRVAKQDVDYTLTMGSSNWLPGSAGLYYWKNPVAGKGGVTENLIDECKVIGNPPAEGYTLHVEILAQSIQAEGMSSNGKLPVVEAWKVTVDTSGTIKSVP